MFIVLKKKIIIAVAACILTIIAIPVAIHYTNNAAEAVQAQHRPTQTGDLVFQKTAELLQEMHLPSFCSSTTLFM